MRQKSLRGRIPLAAQMRKSLCFCWKYYTSSHWHLKTVIGCEVLSNAFKGTVAYMYVYIYLMYYVIYIVYAYDI